MTPQHNPLSNEDEKINNILTNYEWQILNMSGDDTGEKHRAEAAAAIGLLIDKAKEESAANSQFNLMAELQTKMMPLMVHTTQAGFPEMTAEILKEIWSWRSEKFNEASEVVLKGDKQ